ncbi:MAG: DMT family transporter [Pseudomonadota bacterium]|nr:DMT family transporter [Pseudomonadota bacterium]
MPRPSLTLHASPYLLLTLTSLFWSLNWVIGRAIVGHVTPLTLTFIRWVVAVTVMMPFAWPQIRAHWPLVRSNWKVIAWLGFWGTGLHNAFAYVGLQYTTATNGVILNSSIPVMIILLGWLIYRETITRMQALGVGISLLGILAIISRGDPAVLAHLEMNQGDLIVLFGMVFWAAYTVFLRMKPAGLPGLALLACCGVVGVFLLFPLMLFEMLFMEGRAEFTPATIAAMLYVGIFPSFVGYIFWNRGVAEVGPTVAGIFVHLMPAFGALLAWIFLDERIYAFHLVGIALILAGIALTTRGHRAVPEPGPE